LLTGRPPFQGTSAISTVLEVMQKEPPRPSTICPTVDRDLETITLKYLHKDPDRRYGTTKELADDVDRFLHARPVTARRMGPLERCARWAGDIPIVAALTGSPIAHATVWHRRSQWLAVVLITLVGALTAVSLRPRSSEKPSSIPFESRRPYPVENTTVLARS
jgi:serine/threonine protein kinase